MFFFTCLMSCRSIAFSKFPSIAKPKRPKHPNPAQTLFVRKSPHAKKWRDARGNTANLYAGGMQNIQEDTRY
ncbi:hypothetical protein B0T12DRAFT_5479 [Alternaria alternata]|nr:hypothetical protein B0T12DRAFT_5479 [Alternaria alternata]